MARVVVIGAGIAGLVAALELAVAGCEVTVLERAAAPGGKLRAAEVGGRALDAGPTVLTLKDVFDDIFAGAGTTLDAELTVTPLAVLARHAWSGGATLDLHADPALTADAIGRLAGAADARGYARFSADAAAIHAVLDRSYMRASRPSVFDLVRRVGLRGLPRLAAVRAFATLWHALGDYFHDPRLRQLFGRYATYVGASPFTAPATLMLIAHVESRGVWRVAGGMRALAAALARLATARGACFRYDSDVRAVVAERGCARGVWLHDGEHFAADAVIASGDVTALATGQFGDAARGALARTAVAPRSLSALTWNVVTRTRGYPLHHHTVFFSDDYRAEFASLFERGVMPTDPTVYVCAQDRVEDAPPAAEREGLLCLVNAPADGDRRDYPPSLIAACQAALTRRLASVGLEIDFAGAQSVVASPATFAARYPATGGALYGPLMQGWRASFTRPGTYTRLPGLYLAGGSVHPGPGVPMAALSGRLAAQAVLSGLTGGRP